MFRFKKTKTSSDLALAGVTGAFGVVKAMFEKLHGRKSEPVYNCDGFPAELEAAFIREHGTHRFAVYVRLGQEVVATSISIPASHPALDSMPIERCGPSPAEQALREREAKRAAMTPEERQREVEAMYEQRWGLRVLRPAHWEPGVKIGSHNDKRNAPEVSIL